MTRITRYSVPVGILGALTSVLFASLAFAASTTALLPTSDGAYTQWTPSTGTTHFTLVDESACNGTTDYVSTNTTGQRDSYGVNLSSVSNGSTITAVAIVPCASRNGSGSGSATMNVFYRYNGADSSDAGAYAVPTGTTPAQLATTTYSSLSLTKNASSTLEVGAVYSSGTKGLRLSRIATVVTYTPPAPTATTNAATGVGTTTATLQGSSNPNGVSTTGWFRYSSTNPGSCDDAFGTRAPSAGGTALGATTTDVAFSNTVISLSTGTTYYFCAIASSTSGKTFGAVNNFTTVPLSPTAPTALSATNISGTENDLTWTDNSGNENGFTVERSLNSSFGPFTGIATTSANAVSYNDTSASADQTYYYRVRAYNAGGYSSYATSAYVITATVVPVAPTSLSATASSTTINLSWAQSSTNEDGFRVERGTDGVNFAEIGTKGMNVTSYGDSGLSAGTTYYYRVRAYNTVGNSDYSSTTQATTAFAPTVVTNAATNVGTSTTLNGSANPNGVASIGWFRYSTTTPSSCDNSFGIRAPLSGSTNLGSGTSSVPFSRVLGLTASTTYFYCAIASSTIGTSFGDIVSFTTNP